MTPFDIYYLSEIGTFSIEGVCASKNNNKNYLFPSTDVETLYEKKISIWNGISNEIRYLICLSKNWDTPLHASLLSASLASKQQ